MPRWSSYPDEVENLRKIEISFLKKHNYLIDGFTSGTITWTNTQTNSKNRISIMTDINDNCGYLELSYTYNDTQEINYRVQLVTDKSNLGIGKLWFFICPKTKRRCRILHFNKGYFLHRTAFKDIFYKQQIASKKYRFLEKKDFQDFFNSDSLYKEFNKKYFKPFYNGRITKKHSKLLKREKMIESYSLKKYCLDSIFFD